MSAYCSSMRRLMSSMYMSRARWLCLSALEILAIYSCRLRRIGGHVCGGHCCLRNSPASCTGAIRGCLESPCEPPEPLSLRARYAVRGIASEPPQHQSAHRQVDHRFTALREVLILFTEASIAADPGDGAFHHPAARQHREGRYGRRLDIGGVPTPAPGPLHDLQGPAAFLGYPGAQPLPTIGHVRPDVPQPLAALISGRQEPRGHVRIPHIGGVDEDTHQETRRVNEEMALAAVEFFGAIVAMRPPFSVVFTVCASMIAAEGCGWRPI
jgi:hypothetical protein